MIIANTADSDGGAGAAIDWNINEGPLSLRLVYVGARPTDPLPSDPFDRDVGGGGLFSAPFQLSSEIEYADTFGKKDRNNFAVRLQFTRTNARGEVVRQNVVGLNTELTLGRLGLFGRYGISINPQTQNLIFWTSKRAIYLSAPDLTQGQYSNLDGRSWDS